MTDPADKPQKEFEGLADFVPELAAAMAAIASDVAMVIDHEGIIRNVALGKGGVHPVLQDWVGQRWADTVTPETRRKIDLLLTEANSSGVSKRREVSHPASGGDDIPMTYAAIRLGEAGPVLVAGRDLRPISAIQQRFIETQQEMERTYWLQRRAEAHYRLLFQVATDAVLVVDAQSMLVVDANPAASQMFGTNQSNIVDHDISAHVDVRSRRTIADMLVTARTSGNAAELKVRLSCNAASVVISATPFRGKHDLLLLLRISVADQTGSFGCSSPAPTPGDNPDAVVITDSSGRITMSNPAFLELIGAGSEARVKGEHLSRWVAGFDQQLDSVLDVINRHGIATRPTSILSHDNQAPKQVELSAALLTGGEQLHIGITLRHCVPAADPPPVVQDFSEQIRELVSKIGDSSLDQLLAQVAILAEKQIVQQALAHSGGDQNAAARLLRITAARVRKQSLRSADTGRNSDPTLH